MYTTEGDEAKDGSDVDKYMQRENESPSIASVPSLNSSCSVTSSKDAKANECRQSNIGELVGKSKKAAFSLWTLLHAKVC